MRVTSSTALVFFLCAGITFGCGSSDPESQPAPARGGASGISGHAGVDGGTAGGVDGGARGGAPGESGGHGGAEDGGASAGEPIGGAGGRANSAGSGASGAGRGGAAGAPSTLAPHALALTPHGACALDDAGLIECWGFASEVWDIPDGTFTELYSGRADEGTVCAVRRDRSVACFAEPTGTPATNHYPTVPVKTLAVGFGVICGVDLSDAVFCNAANEALTLEPPVGEHFAQVSVGNQFGCGVRAADHSLVCWSADMFGSCAYSPPNNQLESPPGAFEDLSSGAYSSCAIGDGGSASCWGLGEAEDDPTGEECFASQSVGQANPPSGKYRSVVAGKYHTCAIREDGTLACWGAGETIVCGDEDIECGQSLPPEGKFEQVSVGLVHSCAMRADRTVACWGYDTDGDGRTSPPDPFR